MLKHGLILVILIFTIIHVTFGGITETKSSVFVYLIFSQFFQIFLKYLRETDTYKKSWAIDQKTKLYPRGHSMTTWTQFCSFLTSTYLWVDILNPERGQKRHFLTTYHPYLVHVVIERPPEVPNDFYSVIQQTGFCLNWSAFLCGFF